MQKLAKALLIAILAFNTAQGVQIKDLASVVGDRDNKLIGYGLVVGLAGSGDSNSEFTLQAISNMLGAMDVRLAPNDIKSKNTAAVMVTASLPAFAKSGDKLNVLVSSIGDAKSLAGGTLLLTALKGVDGEIYALAQGALAGGFEKGQHPTALRLEAGAVVEQELENDLEEAELLSLHSGDFLLAKRVQDAINEYFDAKISRAIDAKNIEIDIPNGVSAVDFFAEIFALDIDHKQSDKIVVNEKTGSIVSGTEIKISPVLISQGAITLKIEESSLDELQEGDVDLKTDGVLSDGTLHAPAGVSLASLAKVLRKLGASPKDLIEIIQNLKRAGAIRAELEII